jgi:hypothetical protein
VVGELTIDGFRVAVTPAGRRPTPSHVPIGEVAE